MRLSELHPHTRVTMLGVYVNGDLPIEVRLSGYVHSVKHYSNRESDDVAVVRLDSGEEVLALLHWLNPEPPPPLTDPVALEEWLAG